VLCISALPLQAIWLKPAREEEDVIYPLTSFGDVLKAEMGCRPDDFLRAISPVARKRVATQAPRAP
jgi:hypothetical protein